MRLCVKIKQGFLHMYTATKHIFKTTPTSNFTVIANDLINSNAPPIPFRVHTYLLSKPANWQPKIHDIKKQLGLSTYAVKKALKWLLQAGYAVYKRIKTGHTVWRIFDKPQAKTACKPVIPPQFEMPSLASQPVLIITETEIKKETTTTASVTITAQQIPENNVVVSFEEKVMADSEEKAELIYPVQLTDTQKKAAKHVIKKVKQPELQQPVLFALAYYMAQNKVKSPVAYLNGLVTRANNGTFEAIQADTATKSDTKQIDITQEKIKAYKQLKISAPNVAKAGIAGMFAAIRGA
jgi:hypothetical protein